MTSRPIAPTPNTEKIVQFPDPPPEEMTAFYDVNFPAYPASLSLHFGNRETTIITSELATGLRPTESYQGILFPDLLVAFHVDPQAGVARKGYLIPEQGKPPDFVMEVASETTARRDETVKRDAYASMRVGEYWRFDPTGGQQYQTALAGDRLAGGVYEPISIHRTDEGHYWGHSEALNLALCWEDGNLRFWDPVSGSYLPTFEDERADHLAEASPVEPRRLTLRSKRMLGGLPNREPKRRQTCAGPPKPKCVGWKKSFVAGKTRSVATA